MIPAQATVADQREERARSEAKLEAARQKRSEEGRRIRETMDCAPEACLALAEVEPGATLPTLADIERTLQRLKADRERLGGVNLAADEELLADIQRAVDEVNEQFAQVEQIKRFTVLSEEWLPDSDVLTPTSKLKRRGIHARYAKEIEAMYT